jgi:hypothetical protein
MERGWEFRGGGGGEYLSTSRVGGEPAAGGTTVANGGLGTCAVDGEVRRVIDGEHHAAGRPIHRPSVITLP